MAKKNTKKTTVRHVRRLCSMRMQSRLKLWILRAWQNCFRTSLKKCEYETFHQSKLLVWRIGSRAIRRSRVQRGQLNVPTMKKALLHSNPRSAKKEKPVTSQPLKSDSGSSWCCGHMDRQTAGSPDCFQSQRIWMQQANVCCSIKTKYLPVCKSIATTFHPRSVLIARLERLRPDLWRDTSRVTAGTVLKFSS